MRKFNKFLYAIIICLALTSLFVSFWGVGVSFADVPQKEEYYGLDYNTYNALLTIKKVVTDDKLTDSFSKNFFDSSATDGFASYSPTTEEGQTIMSDLTSGKLYLIAGEKAQYESLKTLEPLTSLACLNELSFGGIKELYLDNNNLTTIESAQLNSFEDLTTLSVNCNKLNSISIPTTIQANLTSLELKENNLTGLDLQELNQSASVNLFNNYVEKFSDLKLPKIASLDISFNNITSASETDLITFKTSIGCEPILLVQGLKQDLKAMSVLTIFNNNSIVNNLCARVYYRQTSGDASAFAGEDDIVKSDATKTISSIFIPMGKLTIGFSYSASSPLSSDYTNELKPYSFNISPPSPTVECKIDGNVSTTYNTDKDLTFTQTIAIDEKLPNYQKVVDNIKLEASGITSNDSNVYMITTEGKYSLQFYAEFDGLRSSGVNISAEKTGQNHIALAIIVIVIIVSLIVCGIFLVRWFANGAVVAPLSDKEIYQANKRASRRGSATRYKYSYDKDEKIDESGIYRKNRDHYFGQDYVDLNESDNADENGTNDGENLENDYGNYDYENDSENVVGNDFDQDIGENGDDYYEEN